MVGAAVDLDRLRVGQQGQHGGAIATEEAPDRAHRRQVGVLLLVEQADEAVGHSIQRADQRDAPEGVVEQPAQRTLEAKLHGQAERVERDHQRHRAQQPGQFLAADKGLAELGEQFADHAGRADQPVQQAHHPTQQGQRQCQRQQGKQAGQPGGGDGVETAFEHDGSP